MQTKNLIQASANVLKITNLVVGDVVKQIDTSSYSSDIYYGVVVDLLNDGENTFIQLMRYKKNYNSIDTDIKVFKGSADLNIFPANPDEVKEYLTSTIESIEKNLKDEERKLFEKQEALKNAKKFVSMEKSKELTAASFKELTQGEYNELKNSHQNILN